MELNSRCGLGFDSNITQILLLALPTPKTISFFVSPSLVKLLILQLHCFGEAMAYVALLKIVCIYLLIFFTETYRKI